MNLNRTLIFLFLLPYVALFSQTEEAQDSINDKSPTALTVPEFIQQVISKNKLVLVYLKADWCPICGTQRPMVDEVVKEESGRIELLVIDTQKNPLIRAYFEVDALPMLVLYKNGAIVWNYVGLIQKKDILEWTRYF